MTPELIHAYRSSNEEIAEAAHLEWQRQLDLYNKHLQSISLPDQVRTFLRTCNLHDARWDAFACFQLGNPRKIEFVVESRDEVGILRYEMPPPGYVAKLLDNYTDSVKQKFHEMIGNKNTAHWAYDEWDSLKENMFMHSILLTNGVELNIIFQHFEFIHLRKSCENNH